ncbi:MAG: hypothetical protein JO266_17805 [Acidobacteria bacterium]|nr:hypothetical protein [Acidobacteriota bacterium]
MADLAYRNETVTYARGRTQWGAIWGGAFVFAAIWSVFELLGIAIFATNANPSAALGRQSVGIAIWSIILTIIAMYVAGRETGRLAALTNHHDGLIHGMIMFGLSVVSAIVITTLSSAVLSGGTGVQGSTHSPYILGVFADLGWAGFVALFLGCLAAMGGASQGLTRRTQPVSNVRDMRPAA